jgi:uncharacterized protein
MAADREIDVRDEPDAEGGARFTVRVDGVPVGFAAYQRRGDGGSQVVFTHTEVDDAYEGQGVGSALAARALAMVRERGDRVVPRCPFIAAYIERHPEWADLVVT